MRRVKWLAGSWGCLAASIVVATAIAPRSHGAEQSAERALFPVRVEGKWGFIGRDGRVVIEPRFDRAEGFREGLAAVNIGGKWRVEEAEHYTMTRFRGGKWGYVDPSGKMVVEAKFDEAHDFNGGMAAVRLANAWGYVDRTGKQAVEAEFGEADYFSDGLAAVRVGNAWGYVDRTGKMVIPPALTRAGPFSDELACVYVGGTEDERGRLEGGKWGYMDKTGKVVLTPQCDYCHAFNDGVAIVVVKGNSGFLDAKLGFMGKSGKMVVEAQYECVRPFCDGLALVVKDGMFYYLDRTWKVVLQARRADGRPLKGQESLPRGSGWYPDEARSFGEGLAAFKVDASEVIMTPRDGPCHFVPMGGKWGYIDKAGKVVIKPQFDSAGYFSEGLAVVGLKEPGGDDIMAPVKYGYVDRQGKVVVKPEFDAADSFRNGLAKVEFRVSDNWDENQIGYIDKSGKYVWRPRN